MSLTTTGLPNLTRPSASMPRDSAACAEAISFCSTSMRWLSSSSLHADNGHSSRNSWTEVSFHPALVFSQKIAAVTASRPSPVALR